MIEVISAEVDEAQRKEPSVDVSSLGFFLEVIPDELNAVDRLMADVVEEHIDGILLDVVQEHLSTGGKRIRARMALSAAGAMGIERTQAVAWAAACELLHNATLIHDDIQDGDRVRRGRPAVWAQFGAGQAINAGDALLMLPTLAIERGDYTPVTAWALSSCLNRRAVQTANGQSLEMHLAETDQIGWDDYERAAIGKTGQLFALPFEGAALLKGWSRERARELGEATLHLGLLYQIQDDVMGMFGRQGRACFGDIREGRVTALVAEYLERCPDAFEDVTRLLRDKETYTDAAAEKLRDDVVESGALDAVLDRARAVVQHINQDATLSSEPTVQFVASRIAVMTDKVLASVRSMDSTEHC